MSEIQNSSSFESQLDQLKVITITDGEVWSARDLMPYAGYERWENWCKAIQRAAASVNASGISASDHFRDSTKMVTTGSGARREVVDVELTRHACYILFQNADGSKPEVAAAQLYFAIQTRKQEVAPAAVPSGAELIALAVVEAQRMLSVKDEQIAVLEPKAAYTDTMREADGLRTIMDALNDLKVHAASNYPGVKVLRDDVFDLAGVVEIIIRGNTVRNNQPTSKAIESGWVKPKDTLVETNNHGSFLKTSARLTPRGYGRLWDAAVTNLKTHGQVLAPKKEISA